MIRIHKDVLFQFMHSHSRLSQAEYNRNPAYNIDHFACKAETAMVEDMGADMVAEYFAYVGRQSE